jgi:hypothetical protein
MRWKTAAVFFVAACVVAVCVVVDFFPRFGPPDFRYTGSDPATHVWNLGWPLAEAIYDHRSGFHVGPLGVVVFSIQTVVVMILAMTIAFTSKRRRVRKMD